MRPFDLINQDGSNNADHEADYGAHGLQTLQAAFPSR